MKCIEIKCQGAGTLPLENLTQFQGNLKTITPANLKKLRSRIIDTGFVAPIFIWKQDKINYILDGTQRLLALKSLQQKGYHIPDLPVAYIEADNEEDAKQKLLSITSQYGEFDVDELRDWTKDFSFEMKDSFRFTNKEFEIDAKQQRGKKYNNEIVPEIEHMKLVYRIESMNKIDGNKCIELFAGRGALTYWYERSFKEVVTNDKQEFNSIEHTSTKTALSFINTELTKHINFDYIDFDDEGCPCKEIQAFFNKIKGIKKDPFVLAITDGQGLNLKSHGKINFYKTYMTGKDETVQTTSDDYYDFVNIFRKFISIVTLLNKYKAKELSLYLKENGNVIYATYLVSNM